MPGFVDIKARSLVASFSIVVVSLLTYFSNYILVQLFLTLLLIGLSVTALWEYSNLLKAKQIDPPFGLLSLVAAAFITANYLVVAKLAFSLVVGIVIAGFFFAVFLYNFYRINGAIVNIAVSFFGGLYIVIPLGLMLRILYCGSISDQFSDGRLWFAYLIAVTKITDIGAYFIGRMWGKSKLAPSLSPGKTLIGAIAGFISAEILSLIFMLIGWISPPNLFYLTLPEALFLGGLMGIFSQLGDLAESLLKRDACVKDSNCIPGMGGVLDLLDSLLFTTPILYLFLRTTHL